MNTTRPAPDPDPPEDGPEPECHPANTGSTDAVAGRNAAMGGSDGAADHRNSSGFLKAVYYWVLSRS
jgi:hypothetical protein